MEKTFPTNVVLSVTSGRLLCKFSELQDLMDHFYPGIMTLGTAAMQPTAARELCRQFPVLKDLPEFKAPWEEWLTGVSKDLPTEFAVSGPHNVSDEHAKAAFDAFGKSAR